MNRKSIGIFIKNLFLLIFTLQPGVLHAKETPFWILSRYDGPGGLLAAEMRRFIEAGYTPVGFEQQPAGNLSVLYVTKSSRVSDWRFEKYKNTELLERAMDSLLRDQWVPYDLSVRAGAITVLFCKTDLIITDWLITSTSLRSSEVKATISRIETRGLSVWGISVTPERTYLLAIDEPGENVSRTKVERVPNNERAIRRAINRRKKENVMPQAVGLDPPILYMLFEMIEPEGRGDG